MRLKLIITAAAVGVEVCLKVQAMDRWAALSQLETRDNDNVVGAAGEISRFQIKPKLWQRYARSDADWKNPVEALAAAQQLMKERCAGFQRTHNRPPTDFEFYVLWNAPAQLDQPRKVVRDRAERFSRLVAREDRQVKAEQSR
jgi:hypothetical protein